MTSTPPATLEQILARYPDVVAAEAVEPTREPPHTGLKPNLHGFTLAELRTAMEAGEWAEVEHNPVALECFALALREARQIENGITPQDWTGTIYCGRCGPVAAPAWQDGLRIPSCRRCGG